MKKTSKNRLFEVMGRMDQNFNANEADENGDMIEKYAEKLNTQHLSHAAAENAMDAANKYLEGYGVESITDENEFVDNYFRDAIGIYVNMGDTYTKTIVYDTKNKQFLATSWGDFVESRENFFGDDGMSDEGEMDEADLNDGTTDDSIEGVGVEDIGKYTVDDENDMDEDQDVRPRDGIKSFNDGDVYDKNADNKSFKADLAIDEIGPEMGAKAFKADRTDSRTRKIRQDVLDSLFKKYLNNIDVQLMIMDRSSGQSAPVPFRFAKVELRGANNGDIFAFTFFSQEKNASITLMYNPADDEYLNNIDKYEFNPQMVNVLIYNAKLAKKLADKMSGRDGGDSALTKNDFKMYATYSTKY
jgi:hypothetical protein